MINRSAVLEIRSVLYCSFLFKAMQGPCFAKLVAAEEQTNIPLPSTQQPHQQTSNRPQPLQLDTQQELVIVLGSGQLV